MSREVPGAKDVRMHGFSQRSEVGAVLQWIDKHARRMGRTLVSLNEASGRVLAEQVVASITFPLSIAQPWMATRCVVQNRRERATTIRSSSR